MNIKEVLGNASVPDIPRRDVKVSETTTNAQVAACYISFLDAEHLLPPKLPTHEEMENLLLSLRKNALVEEYFGNS